MLQNVYQHSTQCLVEDMHGELLIYNPLTASTVQLNGSSQLVWSCFENEVSVQEVVHALQEAFPQAAEQIEADVLNVVSEFASNGLLRLVEGDA